MLAPGLFFSASCVCAMYVCTYMCTCTIGDGIWVVMCSTTVLDLYVLSSISQLTVCLVSRYPLIPAEMKGRVYRH